ncbi:MAG: type II toxin-antitoxin system RelE/ParE family toxin [Bacteroidales bacterium]|nr:type II toxin-antitoxin system RelE/ParE family toxin [Bacteroidales bacterium]
MDIVKVETYRGEKFHIFSFCDENGTSEVDAIAAKIDNSQKKQISKLETTFEKAALFDPSRLPDDRCHHLEDGVWQFRADDIRVLWFYDEGNLVICTHAFIKKVKKTPRKQITKAKQRRAEYFTAKESRTLRKLEERNE